MNDTTPPPSNPFKPGEPHGEVWPEGFEPGRDLAELGTIESIEGVVVASASVGEELPERRHRDMRRLTVEKHYEPGLRQLFGNELATVYKHAGGAVLYFRPGKGRIADAGSKLTALGDMPEHQAAVRIVAIAKARGARLVIGLDTVASRREMAPRFGVDHALDPAAVQDSNALVHVARIGFPACFHYHASGESADGPASS